MSKRRIPSSVGVSLMIDAQDFGSSKDKEERQRKWYTQTPATVSFPSPFLEVIHKGSESGDEKGRNGRGDDGN
jgi:hypothetical protein